MSSVEVLDTENSPLKKIDFKAIGPALALLILCIIGYLLNPAFLGEGNITNLLTRSALMGSRRHWLTTKSDSIERGQAPQVGPALDRSHFGKACCHTSLVLYWDA